MGAGAGNLDADIRLVDKASLPSPNVEYISLSYRWGASNNLKTTNRTLDDHQKGIPMGALPRTLRDAVIVARRLSIRYLWIDSLCIIQDNKADWATEAQHMGDIYMNSAFVIAAHAARHADHGFLEQSLARPKVIPVGGRRDGGKYDAETAAYADFQGKLTDNACKGDQVKPVASDVFFVAESVNLNGHLDTNSALTSRGWVLQERALARKTIHFCTNGAIYLETGSTILSINDHPHHPSLHSGPQELRAALHQFNGGEPTPSPVPASLLTNARKGWYDLVAQYSTRSLTEPRDKLIAISGIARKLQPILDNDNYYCGLWERHMHTNLLWLRRTARLTPSSFSARARAPSWSWAAHDAAVQFPTWSHEGSDDVVRPEIRFGKVLNGELPPSTDSLFDGWGMLELRDAVRIGTGLRFLAPATGKPHWTMGPNAVTMPYQTRFWGVGSDAGGRIGWAAFDWEERDELDGNVDRITCFKVASFSNDRPESGFKRGFLVLFAKLVNPALGIFGRVGMGQIMDASLFDDRDASTRHERLVLV